MRTVFLNAAKEWLNRRESNNSHREIIDLYNTQKPLPRGYKVKYTDSWCAVFVSAVAIKCKMEAIIPIECSCGQMIALAKNMGIWQEKDDHIPETGDIILYDWNDSGKGDNKGWPEHVGIVEAVEDGRIKVIEGNIDNSVDYRILQVDGRYIRGFICPQFNEVNEEYYPVFKGDTNSIVDALKTLGIDASYAHRKKIAQKNGLLDYTGKAKENLSLLALLKDGKLIKE